MCVCVSVACHVSQTTASTEVDDGSVGVAANGSWGPFQEARLVKPTRTQVQVNCLKNLITGIVITLSGVIFVVQMFRLNDPADNLFLNWVPE